MTIRSKLVALTMSAVLLIIAVAAAGALVSARVAVEGRKSVSDAVRSAMVADMMHDAVNNDVYRAINATDRNGVQQARADLAAHAQKMRAELANAAATGRSPNVEQAVLSIEADVAKYLATADELTRLVESDRSAAIEGLDEFAVLVEDLEQKIPIVSDAIDDSEAILDQQARDVHDLGLRISVVLTFVAVFGLGFLAVRVARSITKPLNEMLGVVAQVSSNDLLVRDELHDEVDGDDARVPAVTEFPSARIGTYASGELGILGAAVDGMLDAIASQQDRLRVTAERSAFGQELGSALDMVDTEHEVYAAARRAMTVAAGESKMELLLSDSSNSHLEQAAVHPSLGGAGCTVDSPYGCAAVRRGATVVFRSSDALDACPKLVDRPGGPHVAVCAPVGFMGKALGVVHSTRPVQRPFTPEQIERIGTFASGLGTRIGTVRAFERTQIQASTDGLTGLTNRRTMEERIGQLYTRGRGFAFAIADLDHFKHLNDTFGHETGDRALGQFAQVLKTVTRSDDIVARWGGEEFTIGFPDLSAEDAVAVCERVRERLALVCAAAHVPPFTASFGVVASTEAPNLTELFKLADQALYAAKDAGRNRTVLGPLPDAGGPIARHEVERPAAMRSLAD